MTFRPLEGVRILDLSVLIPGAACTRYFADYGADVIKVEQPPAGDWLRGVPPLFEGLSLLHMALDRGKRSIRLDLSSPEGRAVLHELSTKVDAVVEVSRPGALARVGADHETLSAVNPRLVYLSLTGFGQHSRYADIPAHGANIAAFASVAAAGPAPGSDRLVQAATPFGRYRLPLEDAALHGAFALLAALRERDRTGRGRHLDIAIVHTLLIGDQVALIDKLNQDQMFWPEWQQPAAKNAYYRAADGKILGVAPLEEKFWAKFCKVIGREDLVSSSSAAEASVDLAGNSAELYDAVQQAIGSRPRDEWLELLWRERIPSGPLNTAQEALADPDLGGSLITESAHPLTGQPVKTFGPAVRDADGFFAAPAPACGQHTEQILSDLKVPHELVDAARAAGAL